VSIDGRMKGSGVELEGRDLVPEKRKDGSRKKR
jgi:hypothetical protein